MTSNIDRLSQQLTILERRLNGLPEPLAPLLIELKRVRGTTFTLIFAIETPESRGTHRDQQTPSHGKWITGAAGTCVLVVRDTKMGLLEA